MFFFIKEEVDADKPILEEKSEDIEFIKFGVKRMPHETHIEKLKDYDDNSGGDYIDDEVPEMIKIQQTNRNGQHIM